MRSQLIKAVATFAVLIGTGAAARGDDFVIDGVHSGISFQILHAGLSYIHGRFNDFSGTFTLDSSDPTKSSFELTIKADSIDTNNKKRDDHLRAPDFFNVKQFPTITFKSTTVKPVDGGYEVMGGLTMHGETKPVTFSLKGGKMTQFPPTVWRTGFSSSQIEIKRTDFGVGKPMAVLGDDVFVSISFEGTKK